ncbi:hypothetical protein EDD22DRAFT_849254 [Suillus occidentalis]|nr:hypothetical protein EDD22DRAFT_849254 [Suillus occidentalis]
MVALVGRTTTTSHTDTSPSVPSPTGSTPGSSNNALPAITTSDDAIPSPTPSAPTTNAKRMRPGPNKNARTERTERAKQSQGDAHLEYHKRTLRGKPPAICWAQRSNSKGTGNSFPLQRKLYLKCKLKHCIHEPNYLLLQLATNTLASVATTGSGPRGTTEEEFAGSDGDE